MSKLRRLHAAISAHTNAKANRRVDHRRRRPLAELLEERTLLAYTITVNTNADTIDTSFNLISLREAIEISNGTLTYTPATDMNSPKLVSGSQSAPSLGSPPNPNTIQFALIEPTVQLVNWGDGSGVPTSGNNEFFIGIDNRGLLNIRIFDRSGNLVTNEAVPLVTPQTLPATAAAQSELVTTVVDLSPSVPSGAVKSQVIQDVIAIVRQPLLDDEALIHVTGSALPTITEPVLIHGYTQLGSSISSPSETEVVDNTAIVHIDGKSLGSVVIYDGLDIAAPNCEVAGLIITGFSGFGISIENPPEVVNEPPNQPPTTGFAATGNWIWGNFIGAIPDAWNANQFSNDPVAMQYGSPQPANTSQPGNFEGGIRIRASNNRVGGNTPGLPNVIANNGWSTTAVETPYFDPTIPANAGFGVGILIDNDPGLPLNSPNTGTGNLIQGNAIIHNAAEGVFVRSSNNTIGESINGGGNVIAGNLGDGVVITGGPTVEGNRLLGNFIGTTLGDKGTIKKGEAPFQNGGNGVLILDSPRNTVGGTVATDLNVIGPNVLDGVRIVDSNSDFNSVTDPDLDSDSDPVNDPESEPTGPSVSVGNRILNNYIGFNNVGGAVYFLPNQNGVFITTSGNFVGDAIQGAGNTISNNYNNGVLIQSAAASGNTVAGNIIGLNSGGGSAFRNAFDGVHIENAPNNIIGGTTDLARNTISSNNNGVYIVGLVTANPADNQATGNRVLGNFIGTDIGGTIDLGNAVDGVVLKDAYNNDIGNTTSGAGNVISGNNRGIRITGAASINNRIRGNFIGTDLTNTALIHNEIDGIIITAGASENLIGGIVPGAPNTIVNNIGAGINVDSGVGNSILGNEIYNNLGRGITYPVLPNLGAGIFLNPVTSANNLLPAPVLSNPTSVGTYTSVIVGFSGLANHTYRIEIFSSNVEDSLSSGVNANAIGYGQGQKLLDSYQMIPEVTHNLPSLVSPGMFLSATATDETTGDTSSFSVAVPVPIAFTLSNPSYTVNETDNKIDIQVTRNSGVNPPQGGVIAVPYSVGGGTAVAGVDYTATSGILYFQSTDPDIKTFTIPILNPHKKGGSVTANITLGIPNNGAELGTPSNAVLTIVENDTTPTLQLAAATATVNQNAGTISLTVSRDTNIGTTTVDYTTVPGSAIPGVNYTNTSGTITFNVGQLTQTVLVPILNASPNQVAPPLGFTFALSNPTNGGIGPIGSTAVTIIDSATPGLIQPAMPRVNATSGANRVSIQIVRVNGTAGTVTAHYTTTGGTAIPGVDYIPYTGTIVFAPGQTTNTLVIPIFGTNGAGPDVTFNLNLSVPAGGATLGNLTTTLVTIPHSGSGGGGGTVPIPLPSPSTDQIPPTILNFQPLANAQGVFGIALTFSEPMNPTRVVDVSNYGSFLRTTGPDGRFGTGDDGSIQIASAGYDAANNRSVIILATPLPFGTFAAITINGNARLATPKGLTDMAGNYLDGTGVGNSPGSPYSTIFAEGNVLRYFDSTGDTVTLKLTGPGLMTLTRGMNGDAQQLQLLGTAGGKSSLSGTVQKPRRGVGGTTTIASIGGAYGVRINLRPPAFKLGGISAAAIDVLARSNKLSAKG